MTVNRISAGAALSCAVMFLAACGGTSAPATTAAAATTAASGSGAGGARTFPGATGLLAQIDGTTLQVQGATSQTAVTYSASTTFTNTVAAKISDVVVGVCVQARSARAAAGAPPTTAPSSTSGPIVASTVEISAAVNGKCSAAGGLRTGGAQPPGAAGQPTGAAGAPNPGRARGAGRGGSGAGGFGGLGAFGKVTAISATGFTIDSIRPTSGTATTAVPTTETVQTPAGTKYTQTGAANAKALVIGLCVTALGKADDTGSIAATSIILQQAVNGSCSSGFGGGFGGQGAGGGSAPTGGSAGA